MTDEQAHGDVVGANMMGSHITQLEEKLQQLETENERLKAEIVVLKSTIEHYVIALRNPDLSKENESLRTQLSAQSAVIEAARKLSKEFGDIEIQEPQCRAELRLVKALAALDALTHENKP